MNTVTRRRFLESSLGAAALGSLASAADAASTLKIAPFRFDVTPPVGHPLCGGWIKPVVDVTDELEGLGYVLLGAGQPIVVCVVDWTGILNEAHVAWRTALAKAANTSPDRVTLHCVHQHDAPFVCTTSERLLEEIDAGLHVVQLQFFDDCVARAAAAVQAAIPKARAITHVAHGEARVEKVASNRRIAVGPNGKITKGRTSACRDPELIALPEGLVDPLLKTVAFYDGAEKIVACHYYATHPMSFYGQGHVSSDFVGLARKARQREDVGCTHLYFTGASGDVTAGKYNDGSPEARVQLTERILRGMVASEESLRPVPIEKITWTAHDILPQANPVFTEDNQRAMLVDDKRVAADRIRPAMRLAWLRRLEQRIPITLSALQVNDVAMLHLPAESFVAYQLRAQQIGAGRFVATAAYGDGGPWYIPVKEEYPKGGYEVSVAHCSDGMDDLLTGGMRQVLAAAKSG